MTTALHFQSTLKKIETSLDPLRFCLSESDKTLHEGLGVINERNSNSIIPQIVLCLTSNSNYLLNLEEVFSESKKFGSCERLTAAEVEDLTALNAKVFEMQKETMSASIALKALCDALTVKEVNQKIEGLPLNYELSLDCKEFILSLREGFEAQHQKKLGSGAFGVVTKVKIKEKFYALKKIISPNPSTSEREKIEKEASIFMRLDSPHIVKLAGVNLTTHLLFLECASRNSLFMNVKKKDIYSPKNFLKIFIDTAKGLEYLVRNRIIHNDLHLGNILVDDTADQIRALITDFDLSSQQGFSRLTFDGNTQVMPPEKLAGYEEYWKSFLQVFCKTSAFKKHQESSEGEPHPTIDALKKPLSEKMDVWSLGMDIFAMMCGANSIYEMNKIREKNYLLKSIKFHNPEYLRLAQYKFRHQHQYHQIGLHYASPLAEAIRTQVLAPCFTVDPEERPDITTIRMALEQLSEDQHLCKAFSKMEIA